MTARVHFYDTSVLADRGIAWLFRRKVRGARRLAYLATRHQPLRAIRTKTMHGLTFYADPASTIDIEILRHGVFEPHIREALLDLLGDGGVLWDVGANTGVHALEIKHLAPNVHVVAFEPSPVTFARLYCNARANGLEIDMWCLALADRPSYPPLSVVDEGNTGLASLRPWPGAKYGARLSVRAERGDDLIALRVAPSPTVIKIDVEGFEEEVLAGLDATLDSPRLRGVVLESAQDLVEFPHLPVSRQLRSHGFDVRPVSGAGHDYVATRRSGEGGFDR